MAHDEVTVWLEGLARQDDVAIEQVWRQYYGRLVRLAEKKLAPAGRRAADEEDVALSAFHSFCAGAAAGRFPRLEDRHDLWKLLVTITARKAAQQVRHAKRQKRGGGNVRGESVFAGTGEGEALMGIGNVLGAEPTPEVAALAAEQCQRLMDLLPDETLRTIAQRKLEAHTNEEIADELGCAPRTVERKLNRIRALWEKESEERGE